MNRDSNPKIELAGVTINFKKNHEHDLGLTKMGWLFTYVSKIETHLLNELKRMQ